MGAEEGGGWGTVWVGRSVGRPECGEGGEAVVLVLVEPQDRGDEKDVVTENAGDEAVVGGSKAEVVGWRGRTREGGRKGGELSAKPLSTQVWGRVAGQSFA